MKCTKRHYITVLALCLTGLLGAQSIFQIDSLHRYTLDCSSNLDICLPIPATDLAGYSIFMDGNPYTAGIIGCDFDTTINYSYTTLFGLGNFGPYELDSWSVNGNTYSEVFFDINDLVNKMNQWDPQGNWIHNPASLSIEGGAPGKNYSDMEITVLANMTPSTIGLNFGLLPMGAEFAFGPGMHSMIISDNQTGMTDTLMIMVECLLPLPPTIFYDTIEADGLPYTYCLDLTSLVADIVSVENICPDSSGTFVSFYLDTLNNCVKYTGLACNGTETACIVACDEMGMCDTTYLNITVGNDLCTATSQKWNDEIYINFTDSICVDTTTLTGTIISVENICPDESGESVVFEYDENTHCVTYTGIAEGLDEGCFLLMDEMGNVDTAYVCVNVLLPEVGTIIDTILLGTNELYCIDTTELAGNILNIENFCPALSGEEVEFTVDDVTLCLNAFGLDLGTDTACIVICDDYGVCDTTYLYITVVPDVNDPCFNAPPPIAVDDAATTPLNTLVNIDILANDTLGPCPDYTLTVLDLNTGGDGPYNGLTVTNPNQTVDYLPDTDFCGLDSFEYVLCNPNGCDTATVLVEILCFQSDTIIIYNGFSPNDDGINETFTIENIEKFPDSDLSIYNRWGNLVFNTVGYQNDWGGLYEGRPLPDGTYFYYLNLDGRREFKGYLQINK
ncbi:MAG: gliding motility-associated C-terminal domain-containing protein [Bacteroidota bacterium]